jgi:hypothetical protein
MEIVDSAMMILFLQCATFLHTEKDGNHNPRPWTLGPW